MAGLISLSDSSNRDLESFGSSPKVSPRSCMAVLPLNSSLPFENTLYPRPWSVDTTTLICPLGDVSSKRSDRAIAFAHNSSMAVNKMVVVALFILISTLIISYFV